MALASRSSRRLLGYKATLVAVIRRIPWRLVESSRSPPQWAPFSFPNGQLSSSSVAPRIRERERAVSSLQVLLVNFPHEKKSFAGDDDFRGAPAFALVSGKHSSAPFLLTIDSPISVVIIYTRWFFTPFTSLSAFFCSTVS